MATTEADAQAGPPPEASAQDPLPEASWLWRRVVSILIIAPAVVFNLGAGVFLWLMNDSDGLLQLAKWNLGFAALAALLYLAGANMTEITKMMQHSKLLEKGVVLRSTAVARSPDGSTASSTTVAGKPAEAAPAAEPPIAPAPAEPAPAAPAPMIPPPEARADTVRFPWEGKPDAQ